MRFAQVSESGHAQVRRLEAFRDRFNDPWRQNPGPEEPENRTAAVDRFAPGQLANRVNLSGEQLRQPSPRRFIYMRKSLSKDKVFDLAPKQLPHQIATVMPRAARTSNPNRGPAIVVLQDLRVTLALVRHDRGANLA
jgi:hypothetical protein